MVGTTPLIIHNPATEPIRSRITIDVPTDVIFSRIASSKVFHGFDEAIVILTDPLDKI